MLIYVAYPFQDKSYTISRTIIVMISLRNANLFSKRLSFLLMRNGLKISHSKPYQILQIKVCYVDTSSFFIVFWWKFENILLCDISYVWFEVAWLFLQLLFYMNNKGSFLKKISVIFFSIRSRSYFWLILGLFYVWGTVNIYLKLFWQPA